MCEPVTIALALASAGLALKAKSDNAKAVNESAKSQHEMAVDTSAAQIEQLNRKSVEDRENASTQAAKIQQETLSRMGTAQAQVGATGVMGTSVNAMLLNLSGKGLEAQTTAETNYARTVAANTDQANEIARGAKGTVQGIRTAAGLGWQDYAAAALEVGQAANGAHQRQKAAAAKAATGGAGGATP